MEVDYFSKTYAANIWLIEMRSHAFWLPALFIFIKMKRYMRLHIWYLRPYILALKWPLKMWKAPWDSIELSNILKICFFASFQLDCEYFQSKYIVALIVYLLACAIEAGMSQSINNKEPSALQMWVTCSEFFLKWSKNHLFIVQVFMSYFVQDIMLGSNMMKMNMTCHLSSRNLHLR